MDRGATVHGGPSRLAALTPPGFVARIDLTMTDDLPLAQAFVVISAWPADWPTP